MPASSSVPPPKLPALLTLCLGPTRTAGPPTPSPLCPDSCLSVSPDVCLLWPWAACSLTPSAKQIFWMEHVELYTLYSCNSVTTLNSESMTNWEAVKWLRCLCGSALSLFLGLRVNSCGVKHYKNLGFCYWMSTHRKNTT